MHSPFELMATRMVLLKIVTVVFTIFTFQNNCMGHPLFRTKNIDKILRDAETMAEDPHAGAGLKRVSNMCATSHFLDSCYYWRRKFQQFGAGMLQWWPGVVVLFIMCAIACGFTAMCYAEFASRIPVAGSAYTYAYASLANYSPG
jgi:hypothetical protein